MYIDKLIWVLRLWLLKYLYNISPPWTPEKYPQAKVHICVFLTNGMFTLSLETFLLESTEYWIPAFSSRIAENVAEKHMQTKQSYFLEILHQNVKYNQTLLHLIKITLTTIPPCPLYILPLWFTTKTQAHTYTRLQTIHYIQNTRTNTHAQVHNSHTHAHTITLRRACKHRTLFCWHHWTAQPLGFKDGTQTCRSSARELLQTFSHVNLLSLPTERVG